MKMVIGLIGAMDEEIALIEAGMTEVKHSLKAGIRFLEGMFHGRSVVLCRSGVGKVNAAVTTQILIDAFHAERILFTGVAGAVASELNVGDLVVSTECMQHDMDVTALGYPRGTIPFQETSLFAADEALRTLAMQVGEQLFPGRVRAGRVLSGDQFIADKSKVAEFRDVLLGSCVEMEGAAVAQVCQMNHVPFVIIRSMSDKADGSAHVSFAEFTKMASENSFRIIEAMVQKL